jgi:hypothetical protein
VATCAGGIGSYNINSAKGAVNVYAYCSNDTNTLGCGYDPSGANVIKRFTVVIYCHSMVLLSSCVLKHYYYGKYHRMAVNCHDKKFHNRPKVANINTAIIYCSILILEKVG